MIVEEYIEGREIQAGILGDGALPLIEIRSKKEFFDYEAKYTEGISEEIIPAPLNEETTRRIQDLALQAFKVLGGRVLGRVDLFLRGDAEVLVSEVNTIPGLTKSSLYPKEAAAAGISFGELLSRIVDLSVAESG